MTTGLLKTSPLEAMAQRKVEQKGPTSIMKFPANLGAHGTLMRFFEYKYGGERGSEAIPLAEVLLPLPKQIADSYKINVGGNELGILGTAAAQVAGNPNSVEAIARNLGEASVKGVKALSSGLGDAAGGDFSGIKEAIAGATDTAQFLVRAGMGSVSPDIANGIGVGRGTAINPFATLVFSGVDLKVHSLEWLLSPESEKESKQLKKIIRTLQRMVLPKAEGALGEDTGATVIDRGILRYPAMVDTYFQGIDESYFFRFKTAMISTLNVDYTPNGLAINKGGKPSAIRITMTLNEAYIHTADDNAQADVLEEAIQEKIDSVITDSLTSTDGEQAEFDPSIARSATGTTVASNTVASTDEVIVNKVVADGSVESKIMKISELKAQGFSDAQIAGTEPSGINGVTFRIGTGA
jgi:hypothetical protein